MHRHHDVRCACSQGWCSKKLINGHEFKDDFNGFSTKKVAPLQIATHISKQALAQIAFPLWTKHILWFPYGCQKLRLWPAKLMTLKDWHGIANQASPRLLIRSAKAKLWINPNTRRISCSTGSFSRSKPCLSYIWCCLGNQNPKHLQYTSAVLHILQVQIFSKHLILWG